MNQDALPQESSATIKEGIWLICIDGENTIKRWSSATNGKEKVYLNDRLVSEKRSLKGVDKHEFEDRKGTTYQVTYKLTNLLKGASEFQFIKNGEVIKQFNIKYVKGRNFTIKKFLPIIVVSIVFGVIHVINKFPDIVWYIYIAITVVIQLLTFEKGHIELEEVELKEQ